MPINAGLSPDPFAQGFNRLQALSVEIRSAKPQLKAAIILEREIKLTLSQPGSGRWYPSRANKGRRGKWLAKGGKGRYKPIMHQASAPGEPPAPDLADLRRTIGHEELPGGFRVGSPLIRAPRLEYGGVSRTPQGGIVKLKPRPFMRPALAKALPKMQRESASISTALAIRGKKVGR